MEEKQETLIVGGKSSGPQYTLVLCQTCGAEIYVGHGTKRHAEKENIKMICLECAAGTEDFDVAGLINQGVRHGPDTLAGKEVEHLFRAYVKQRK